MNIKLLPYVGAYLGGQIAGITLVALVAKKIMPAPRTHQANPAHAMLPDCDLTALYKK